MIEVGREELERRRGVILARLGVPLSEVRERADRGALVGDEWDAWQELQDIAFLLGEA